MKWYRRKINACEKPLGRLSRMENKSSAFLFEDVANYMMVNGEHNKTRPPLARCHWPRSVIVGWMCFRARGQFVYIEAGVLYFLHHAPLSARFPFSGIHRASQKELQRVQYLTFIISSLWSSLDPD